MGKNNYKRPLIDGESKTKTIGCRHSNPDNCYRNMMPAVCAFCRSDNICLSPPKSWNKLFDELVEEKERSNL